MKIIQQRDFTAALRGNFTIIDTTDGYSVVIGEVDRFSAPMLIHEGAIYMHVKDASTMLTTPTGSGRRLYTPPDQLTIILIATSLDVNLKVLEVSDSHAGTGKALHAWGEWWLRIKPIYIKRSRVLHP